jgi:hypothetical protein
VPGWRCSEEEAFGDAAGAEARVSFHPLNVPSRPLPVAMRWCVLGKISVDGLGAAGWILFSLKQPIKNLVDTPRLLDQDSRHTYICQNSVFCEDISAGFRRNVSTSSPLANAVSSGGEASKLRKVGMSGGNRGAKDYSKK